MISCIPEGDYYLKSYDSPKFGNSVILYGGSVSMFPHPEYPRNGILIHPANKSNELMGCIGLGDSLGTIGGKRAVLNSRKTVAHFLDLININMVYNIRITYDEMADET
jgi:hypothetical protein